MLRAIIVQTSSENFRSDINALRAIAFVAVLLYHFRVPSFEGGFVGVDIFLTISGYLMMSIVSREVKNGKFNLIRFYTRRIGRIVAPIFPVAVATFVAGYFILPPIAFADLGRHTIGMLTFTSNILFWRESGYFNADNAYNFLLHSWSLSLEVQFYIVFPLIFFALCVLFRKRDNLSVPLAVLSISIFIASIFATQLKPIPAFYLLPTRLWQFLLGCLVWEVMRITLGTKQRRILHVIGLILIATSIAVIDSSMSWPGWRASIPSLGVALVLFSNINFPRIYESIAIQFLGTISYSGYLWHWPIVVLLVTLGKIGNPLWQMIGITITIILALLSWYCAERKLGQWLQGMSNAGRLTAIGVLIGSAVILPVAATHSNGMPNRFTQETNRFLSTAVDRPNRRLCSEQIKSHCIASNLSPDHIRSISGIGAIVVGDSHAAMISQIVADKLTEPNSKVVTFTMPACPTIRGVRVSLDLDGNCANSIDKFLALHNLIPSIPIVVSNRYAFYMEGPNERTRSARPNYSTSKASFLWSSAYVDALSQGYFKTLCDVANTGKLFLVFPFPEFQQAVPPRISLEFVMRGKYDDYTIRQSEYDARNAHVLPLLNRLVGECGAHSVNPFPVLCENGICAGTRGGAFLYSDSNHITRSGAALVAGAFDDVAKILKEEIHD